NFGMNAATGEYGDLVEMGVLDPTKVARTALQNASSVASLMLTTDGSSPALPTIWRSGSSTARSTILMPAS
ncbi:MAG TPA: hypothetical protein VG868_12100, partial [Casimicrobiaceae bacterium]|nr:hypothetical protein [Casimicrobiaceae bacterium]